MCQSLGCPCCGNWPDADRRGISTTTTATRVSLWNGPLQPRAGGGYEPAPLPAPAGYLTKPEETP